MSLTLKKLLRSSHEYLGRTPVNDALLSEKLLDKWNSAFSRVNSDTEASFDLLRLLEMYRNVFISKECSINGLNKRRNSANAHRPPQFYDWTSFLGGQSSWQGSFHFPGRCHHSQECDLKCERF